MNNIPLIVALAGAALLSAGCVCPFFDDTGGSGAETHGDSNLGSGDELAGGGEVVIGHNSGGMSDPGKCSNLPPQQMADCLEQSIGG